MKKLLIAMQCALLACLPFPHIAFAGGGTVMGNGGATEITQMLNNGQLTVSVAKQAAMVAEQVRANITALQQYITMIQNLKNLPQALLSATIGPYMQQINDLRSIYNSVTSLKSAAEGARNMLSGRIGEMQALNMSPSQYLRAESALATQKGGIYMQQLNDDIAKLDNLQQRAQQLRTLSDQIPSVSGNVEGLQLLNQQSTMLVGEMMDMKAAVLQQNAIANQERAQKEQDKAAVADMADQIQALERQRAQNFRDFANNVQFKPSWGR